LLPGLPQPAIPTSGVVALAVSFSSAIAEGEAMTMVGAGEEDAGAGVADAEENRSHALKSAE
jgi:hypothetical protein